MDSQQGQICSVLGTLAPSLSSMYLVQSFFSPSSSQRPGGSTARDPTDLRSCSRGSRVSKQSHLHHDLHFSGSACARLCAAKPRDENGFGMEKRYLARRCNNKLCDSSPTKRTTGLWHGGSTHLKRTSSRNVVLVNVDS